MDVYIDFLRMGRYLCVYLFTRLFFTSLCSFVCMSVRLCVFFLLFEYLRFFLLCISYIDYLSLLVFVYI